MRSLDDEISRSKNLDNPKNRTKTEEEIDYESFLFTKMKERIKAEEEIDLSGIKELSTESISPFIPFCENLKILNLNGCPLIDDQVVEKLNSKFLEKLNLSGTAVSGNIANFLMRFEYLKSLDLSHCSKIGKESLEIFEMKNSSIKISL